MDKILFIAGGGDDRGMIELAVSSLAHRKNSKEEFVIITGKNNPNNDTIYSITQKLSKFMKIKLHINPRNIFKIMRETDLAVSAGGITTFELAQCGIPMILISIAENQIEQSLGWGRMGAACYLGKLADVLPANLKSNFEDLIINTEKRIAMGQRAQSLVDGYGANRVANAILELLKSKSNVQ